MQNDTLSMQHLYLFDIGTSIWYHSEYQYLSPAVICKSAIHNFFPYL